MPETPNASPRWITYALGCAAVLLVAAAVEADRVPAFALIAGAVALTAAAGLLRRQRAQYTQLAAAEAAAREAHARVRLATEAGQIAIWRMDLRSGVMETDGGIERLIGYAPGYVGEAPSWMDVTHPDDRAWMLDAWRAVATGERARYDVEHRLLHKDGSTRWVEVRATAIRPESAAVPIAIAGTTRDITARKLAEQSLAESQRRLATLFASLPGMAYRCRNDPDWTMEFVSESAWALTGYRADQLVGNCDVSYGALIHPADVGAVWRGVQLAVAERRPFQLTYRIRAADGREKWVWEQGVGVFDDKGALQALEGFIGDITERRQAEAEREKLQAELTQAQKMESVGRLAGGVAHDFNNMLGVILGRTELALGQVEASTPLHAELTEIMAAAQRSADLTRQLLAFARRQTVAPRVLDLNDTVSGMLKMLRRLIGEDIDLAWMPGASLWPVEVDPTQISQVLANLAVNARDAIGGVGRLTIETRNADLDLAFCALHPGTTPGPHVVLSVSDDGAGMTPDVVAHLFEPFFTTKGIGKGTGLGLATIYGIVKQNGGFVDVHSEPAHGTTFTIYLPRAVEAAPDDCAGAVAARRAAAGETVLLVEDEPPLLRLSRQMLARLGYTVLTAGDPREALQVAGAFGGDIHLLVTDVVMPVMNGRELAERLAASRPGLRRLFVSGYTADVIAHHGVLDEDVCFLQKPYTLDTLAAKIREALDGARPVAPV